MTLYDKLQAKYPNNFDACFDFSPPDGWEPLVEKLVDDLLFVAPDLKIDQVKDKFGELRVYTSYSNEAVDSLIDEAEEASIKTCMQCGNPGEMRERNGWYYVACNEHV